MGNLIKQAFTSILLSIIFSTLFVTLLITVSVQQANAQVETREFAIPAGPIILAPDVGINIEGLMRDRSFDQTIHYLLQFEELPNWLQRQEFEEQGIKLTNYVGSNTYIASSKVVDLTKLQEIPSVRFADEFKDEFKLSVHVRTEKPGQWAVLEDDRIAYVVHFHKDVSITKASEVIRENNGEIIAQIPIVPSVIAAFQMMDIANLAKDDSVLFIDFVEPPLAELNDGARVAASVDPLNASPYSLTGNGVTILVFDGGQVDTHIDFGTRIIENDASAFSGHATHVAGTVGGSGANSNGTNSAGQANNGIANQWAGMAPAVNIRSFGNVGGAAAMYNGGAEINNDFPTAINNGIDLATMSLGHNAYRWNPPACGQLGDYSNTAITVDNIVNGSINNQQLIFFQAAGNERGVASNGTIAACGNYTSISSPATAKNSIAVGAINSNDNSIAWFTSWGPTDDGRLKPDITAPGCQTTGDNGLTSPDRFTVLIGGVQTLIQNGYNNKCGTSMATPVASGSASLLIEQWQSTRGANSLPLPHTVKAILVHTATDLGNPGPDYQFGWGALNASAAVDLVIADDSETLIHVDQVDTGQTDTYSVDSDGVSPIEVTLVWDDPPATALTSPSLINDLDVWLKDPSGSVYQPFVLDPVNPANNATTGNDSINNVERIVSPISMEGKWWVTVNSTTVPQGPQQYTLITSEPTPKPGRCDPLFPMGVYPGFYRQLYTTTDSEFKTLIHTNPVPTSTTLYYVSTYLQCIKPAIVVTFDFIEFPEFPPICVNFESFDPLGPPIVPFRCPVPDPCVVGLQCPEPLDYLRFEIQDSILRDVGLLVNGKITQTQFDEKLDDVLATDQINITSGPLQHELTVDENEFVVEYFISGAKLDEISLNPDSKSLTANIQSFNNGQLTVSLPRSLIDAKMDGQDDEFFVLVDAEEVDFEETAKPTFRTLTITFPDGAEEIEIIGSFVVPEFGSIVALILAASIAGLIFTTRIISKMRLF